MNDEFTLVLGGARSGKSRYAETHLRNRGISCSYIATAQAFDEEMVQRIAAHRTARGSDWTTYEAPFDLAAAVAAVPDADALLIDCLTLWLSNHILQHSWDIALWEDLERALTLRSGPTVLVSNEVGLSIVPDTSLGRQFRDAQGSLNQRVAARAQRVIFVAAGLPLFLKGAP